MADNTKTQGVIVVEGAQVKCSLGSLPKSSLKIKHKEDNKYFVNEKKIATWLEDDKDHMNFVSCKRSNPQPACTPDISWSDYYENAEFGKQKILIDKSQGKCKYKGMVTIAHHGQTSQPSSRIYKKDNKDSYDIFMLSPQLAATKGKKQPSVSKIDILPYTFPMQSIPANREVAFEIGGSIKNITLIATVGKNEDASLVSWAFYKGDTQKDRSKTYLEHGSTLNVKLEDLPEGKTTIYGYGQIPSGESTKIVINRKHNKLEGINLNLYKAKMGNTAEIPKKTYAIFTPKYTFPIDYKNQIIASSSIVWRIKDAKGNILYTNAPGFSADRKNSTTSAGILSGSLVSTFQNNGSYIVELEDSTLIKQGMVPDKKTLTVKVKNRSAKDIVNKGDEKIRKTGSFHLTASGITFDYGGTVGLGNRVFWFVQKDNGKAIALGLRSEVRMSVSALMEEFRKKQQIITDPYGIYKFQVFGEDKSQITTIGKGSDTALIEVAKNRMESIGGPVKIPVGAVATYETHLLMSLVTGENILWNKPQDPSAIFNLSADEKEATLKFKKPGKVKFSAYLEGTEVSNRPVEKTIEAAGASLDKALWCYANGKKRAETGWEEENYIHISLEGLSSTPVKIKVWVEHPEFDPQETFTQKDCLLKEIETTLNDKGSCQVSFIADKEIKEKIQKINPAPDRQANLLFTLEFANGKPLDLSKISLTHKQSGKEVEIVVSEGKNLYLVLDPGEYLKVPAPPRITAINFSNEAADNIQVGPTKYGAKHTIWVNTVGMPKEKLVVIVYKQLLKDDMKETYNNKEKAFAATAQVKKYEAQEVGTDGLLALDFTPEKKDADGDPQLFYVTVFKEKKNDKGETELVEVGSQLKSLDSLPFDKELNKDATQVGIVMPTLEEGQTPTAEQLKDVVSKFFHFYNPLYVSETGTIEDQQVISPVLVERGDSKKKKDCYCHKPLTVEFFKDMLFKLWSSEINGFSKEKIDATLWDRQKNLDDKKLERTVNEFNRIFTGYNINTCMQKIVFIALGYAETRFRLLGEDLSEYSSSKSIYKGRGFHQLTGIQDSSGLYNEAGPYEKYADFVGNKNIISQPDLLCTQIHYAIDSAGWFWTDKTNGKSVPNWSSASNTEYIKFRAEYFSKALGKQLNEVSHLVEEDEKYFWLQAKMLNGYPKGQKLETNPYGWTTRKKAFDILKNEVFEFDKRCKGNEELEFTGDRAPWMNVAIQEIINYGGKNESSIDSRIRQYHKEGGGLTAGSGTAWCSSFICWVLENSNPKYKSPHSAGSRDFLTHSSVEGCDVFFGAIAVFSDCDSTGTNIKSSGHVTFVFGKLLDKEDTYAVLGGNQGDMITLSPNYRFHGKAFPMNKKKTTFKIFRGFFKPKGYIIKEEDKLNKNDEYATIKEANRKLKQKTQDTSKGESSR
ncbi:PAAR-like protein [Apibacter adventoris]|uniref:DUF4280 domain-containing protein n=1 Tax=Apibacter adventoris TaxID=1679466 RepID=A0A2S8A7N0_9FLAO|nr:PAAR-like protein [Apibacter adventoris]PQL90571.1 hypothetical protein C4S77_11880 [Apibacter adventoris]